MMRIPQIVYANTTNIFYVVVEINIRSIRIRFVDSHQFLCHLSELGDPIINGRMGGEKF